MEIELWRQTDVKNWVMSDEWWVMSDKWWKLSDENWVTKFCWPNRLLTFSLFHFSPLTFSFVILGSVWIELILLKLKTENWKYCSKIIFKCINGIVRPIFNEKADKKWSLWDPWTVHLCIVHKRPVNSCGWRKKKEKKRRENADAARLSAIQTYT